MTALLPALAQVGQIGSEFALAPARGHALRKGFRTHRAMDHLATDVQLPGDRALAESLSMQSDDLFIAGQAIGPADLPTPLGSRERVRLRGACPRVLQALRSLVLLGWIHRHG